MMVPISDVRAGFELAGKGPVRISHVRQDDRDHDYGADQQEALTGGSSAACQIVSEGGIMNGK
jgi:hypothetical protein